MTKKKFKELLNIENMKKSNGELYVAYKDMFENFKNLRVGRNYYKDYYGKGRNIKVSSDYDENSLKILKKFCNFTLGNDAPRGGATGDYIEIEPKEFKKLQKRLSYIEDDINFIYISKAQRERGAKCKKLLKEFLSKYPKAKDYIDFLKENSCIYFEDRVKYIKKILEIKGDGVGLVRKWVDAGQPHPAPKEVVALKKASGMSWTYFLNSLGFERKRA